MGNLPNDPLDGISFEEFSLRLRQKAVTVEATTRAYIARIEELNSKLGAYVHVSKEDAIEQARAIDRALVAGQDLGPLMGIPVALKDLFVVEGMPSPEVGSKVNVRSLLPGGEGAFVRSLRRAGCVILGKTTMTEFALGLVNLTHKTPWNPWDQAVQRVPGGSSSGSAVALAGGLCALAIGTDTGGSVREPAALCGVFGLKTTFGLWPCDGMFPTSPTLDTIGIFTPSARDAAAAFSALAPEPIPKPRALTGLRFGRPSNYYFDNLDSEVADGIQGALEALVRAGAVVIPVEVPGLEEMDEVFGRLVPSELLATLGRERFIEARNLLDPLVWERVSPALTYPAISYIRARRYLEKLSSVVKDCMRELDAWISPTAPGLAPPVEEVRTLERAIEWIRLGTQNTRPGNMFGQCACSIPLRSNKSGLPIGLQVICAGRRDRELLSIAQGIESVLGRCPRPKLWRSQ